jgi:hypothetical protein
MQFTFETVDDSVAVGGQARLAFDIDGNPRIAYASATGKVMLASRNSGTWTPEEVFGAGLIGPSDTNRVCLQMDSAGNPHVAFQDRESGHLIHGVRRDGNWTFTHVPTQLERLEPGGVAGYDFRLYFQRDTPELRDTQHFVFHDLTTGQLGYTRKIAEEFKLVVAAPADGITSNSGLFPSMSFEVESGRSLVAYVEEFAEDDLPFTKIAMKGIFDPFQGTLTNSVILAQDRFRVVRSTSIACTDDAWCLVYHDFTGQTLNAFFNDASLEQPHKETVSPGTIFPVVPSVATARGLGAPGKDFAVAYGDDNKLKLASRNKFGEWTVEVVDSEGGDMPSFNYDRSGKAHITYAVGQKLKYARDTE